jgi:hypothetical protein
VNRRKALIGLVCVLAFIGLALLILGTYDTQPERRSLPATTTTVPFPDFSELDPFLTSLTTTTTTQPATQPRYSTPAATGEIWHALALCECGGNYACNTGNGYGGGYQFAHGESWSTWRAFGGLEFALHPWEATPEQQTTIAERVLARSGWQAWPGCAKKLGLL